ncbi:MAG: ParA family protein [Phycisphaerales bacterium]|nr:ParA family protein [Phycisphaerales bacterium]
MRSLAILNQKGGVGKTTTAVNLAAALARLGRNVLLVDLDPQSHASLHVGIELSAGDASIYDVLLHGAAIAEAARTVSKRLSIVPAHIDLVAAELELAQREERERVLAGVLGPYASLFDYCIIDCSPSLGLLTVNALAAAGEVLIPLQAHFLALHGLGRLLESISLVRHGINPQLRVAGVLFCMFEKATKLSQEVAGDVEQFLSAAEPDQAWHGARVFSTTIRRNVKLAECPSFGKHIFDYAPASHGAEDYFALAKEIAKAAKSIQVVAEAEVPVASVMPSPMATPSEALHHAAQ